MIQPQPGSEVTVSPSTGLATSPVKSSRFTCLGCRIKFESVALQREHYKTEWHLYNLKRRVCNLSPIDLESFDVIQASAPKNIEIDTNNHKKKRHQSHSSTDKEILIDGSSDEDMPDDNNQGDDDEGEDDWEEIDEEELSDGDYDEEEAARMLANVIKRNVCLFCDKKSHNINKNVEHMNSNHGFFIPEDQYLIDLDGMMEYLGFKVGAGATCLWCNKQFKSVHGVRLHMLYKDHCKILYDQDKAIDEFKDFYDYSTQQQIQMKPLNQLAIPKRRSESHSEYSNALVKANKQSDSKQLIAKGTNLAATPGSYQAKNIKKFNAYRAKIILRTGMANNQSMRGRLRQQNPI